MAETQSVDKSLRDAGLVESGVEAPFDRLARLIGAATRAPMCVVVFGTPPDLRVKGCAGPPDKDPETLVPLALHEVLMEGRREVVAHEDAAGCAITTAEGLVVGALWVRTDSPRTWTDDALDALETGAVLLRTELESRKRRRPDEMTARILESISDACVFLDPEWRYTYVNQKAGEIFSREPSSLVGKHIWTEFPEGVGQRFYHAYHEAAETQAPVRIEEYYPPYDRWFENRIYPSKDGLAIFFQDVTEHKRAELERERIADKQRKEMEVRAEAERMAHLGFWVWEIRANRVTWSDELFRIYGLDPSASGASFEAYLDRVHPQDRKRVRGIIEQALRDKTPMSFEERIVRPSGEVRWLRSWGNVSVDGEGQPDEMFGTCVDMTEVIQSTEELGRTEAWLRATLEATRIALWEWEIQENRVRWSTGAETALGFPHGELGKSFDAYLTWVHPDDREGLVEALRASVKTSAELHVEHRLVFPDDAVRWVVARGDVAQDAARRSTRILGTVVDVTELHHAESDRRRLLDTLRHAQKMEAVGQLAASVAHDLNNMLTVIQAAHQVLAREASVSAAGREAVMGIDEAYRRASDLTARLLEVSRKRERKVEAIDLNSSIEAACRLYRRLLPDDIELKLDLAPDLPWVLGDRGQIEQVLLNLVVNARDAMKDGGTLTIVTARQPDRAVLEISDTGVGMTPEVRARIFEPFYTTKERAGTGLGLATVYGIVHQSNGDIEVQSAPGNGARFTIRLPYAEEDS